MRVALAVVMMAAATARAEPPPLESTSVVVMDSATGELVLDKHGDEIRPIASLTKIFVALVLRERGLDLDGWSQITEVDVNAAEGGAQSSLPRGQRFRNRDLLHAMLLVSENRVPTALARAVGLSPSELLEAIEQQAARLGLEHTHFDDVTGILGNRATARELAVALGEALKDPVLARIMRTRRATVTSKTKAVTIDFKSSVPPLWHGFTIRGGKTGTTEGAGHCMIVGAELDGREVAMVFLGGETAGSRLRDFKAVVRSLERTEIKAPTYRRRALPAAARRSVP